MVFRIDAATAVVSAPVRVVEGLGHRYEMPSCDDAFDCYLRGELVAVRGRFDRDVVEPGGARLSRSAHRPRGGRRRRTRQPR
jgi:hypothetical protein